MLYNARAQWLDGWCSRAQLANVTYFRVRRELYRELTDELSSDAVDRVVRFTDEEFFTIKQFLTSRNEVLPQEARFAFDKTVIELAHKARVYAVE